MLHLRFGAKIITITNPINILQTMSYKLSSIAAAFSTMGRLVNNGERVIFTKIEGLNSVSCGYFKEAVTHSFKDEHGTEILKRLFIPNEDGVTYHFNTSVSPDYRTDPSLPERIAKAMTIVARDKRNARSKNAEVDTCNTSTAPAVEENTVKSPELKFIDDQIRDLYEEIHRLEALKAAHEKLNAILKVAGISAEELKALIEQTESL